MISNEEKLLKERIRLVFSTHGMNISRFSESETDRVMLGRQINGTDTIVPYRTLYRILYAFHDVDANWLMLGEGTMKRTADHPKIFNHNEVNGSTAGGSINVGTSTIPYSVQALLYEKDKRIAELEKDKAQLQSILSIFTRQVEEQKPKK